MIRFLVSIAMVGTCVLIWLLIDLLIYYKRAVAARHYIQPLERRRWREPVNIKERVLNLRVPNGGE